MGGGLRISPDFFKILSDEWLIVTARNAPNERHRKLNLIT